jgi:hypothetical protein
MSDRVEWLEEWCPTCRSAPGNRCRQWRGALRGRHEPIAHLHVARGWRTRRCPTCKAPEGERCRTPSGREASRVHASRLRPGPRELLARSAVWEELERRGVRLAVVPFVGRAGRGGEIDAIKISKDDADGRADSAFGFRDALALALEAPVWDRYGMFAGQPWIRGEVIWTTDERLVVISGRRGDSRFEEIVP